MEIPETTIGPFRHAVRMLRALVQTARGEKVAWWPRFAQECLGEPDAQMFAAMDLEHFEKKLGHAAGASFSRTQFAVLPKAPRSSLTPVVWLKIDLGRVYPDLRLRVVLVESDGTPKIGFRFESPEGPGLHNYYHVQQIRPGDLAVKHGGEEDLSVHQPAFPMPVLKERPYELIFALLHSVYSGDLGRHLQSELRGANALSGWLSDRAGPREAGYAVSVRGDAPKNVRSWAIDGAGSAVNREQVALRHPRHDGRATEAEGIHPIPTGSADDRYLGKRPST